MEITRNEFMENYDDHCSDKNMPNFLPTFGYCPVCAYDIVEHYIENGYKGNDIFITGCPNCHTSFCE